MRCDWRDIRPTGNPIRGEFQFQWGAIEGVVLFWLDEFPKGFQFQWGAIEGQSYTAHGTDLTRFQFQWGAIEGQLMGMQMILLVYISIPVRCDWRTFWSKVVWSCSLNFNSSEVRLKVELFALFQACKILFQFQWGAIEGHELSLSPFPAALFQFQWGAIEG